MGGILFGWTSIISLLLSSPSEGGAGLTNESVHTMFVIASFCSFLGPLCLGILLDIYGPRICSTVSIIIIVFGFLLMGFAEEGSIHPFIIAMCFIGIKMFILIAFILFYVNTILNSFWRKWSSECNHPSVEPIPHLESICHCHHNRLLPTLIFHILSLRSAVGSARMEVPIDLSNVCRSLCFQRDHLALHVARQTVPFRATLDRILFLQALLCLAQCPRK